MKIIRFLAIFCSFLLFFCLKSYGFGGADKYLVENISVNVTADSPADARDLAFKTARREALGILLSRLNKNPGYKDSLSDDEIMQTVRSEQIFDEKIYGNNYSGSFKVTFAKNFVKDLFDKKGDIADAGEVSRDLKFLVIPIKILQNKTLFWESGNDFKKLMKDDIVRRGIDNFEIIEADIENLSTLNIDNVKNIGDSDLDYLFTKYGADVIYFAFYSYDREIAKASVLVRGFEKNRKFQYRLGFVNSRNFSEEKLIDRVSRKVVNYLTKLNVTEIRAQKLEKDVAHLEIPLFDLSSWLEIKNRIENNNFVIKMEINSISRDYAKVSVTCENSFHIIDAFARMGLVLKPRSQNTYLLIKR